MIEAIKWKHLEMNHLNVIFIKQLHRILTKSKGLGAFSFFLSLPDFVPRPRQSLHHHTNALRKWLRLSLFHKPLLLGQLMEMLRPFREQEEKQHGKEQQTQGDTVMAVSPLPLFC